MRIAMRWACSVFVVAVLVAGCGGGGGSGNPSPNNTPVASTAVSIGASGGTISIGGQSITFPVGAVADGSTVNVAITSDPVIAQRFNDGTILLSPYVSPASIEMQVNVGNVPVTSSVAVKATLPQNLIDSLSFNSGQTPLVMFLQTETSNDTEAGESIDTFAAVPVTFDASTSTVTATIPASAFVVQADRSNLAIIKLALMNFGTQAAARNSAQRITQASTTLPPSYCPTPTAPLSRFSNPLNSALLIIGPYGEPRFKDGIFTHTHAGIDFRAQTSVPVYAAASGYIQAIGQMTNGIVYVVVRHPDNSATSYLHLQRGSVNVPLAATKSSELGPFQEFVEQSPCNLGFIPKFPVLAGTKLATSGDTGIGYPPHLHFGYIPAQYLSELMANAQAAAANYLLDDNPISLLGMLSATFTSSGSNSVTLGAALNQDVAQLSFTDNTSTKNEIKVRRLQPPNEVFESVVAQGAWDPNINGCGATCTGSYTPVFNVSWSNPIAPVSIKTFTTPTPYLVTPSPVIVNYDSAQALFAAGTGVVQSPNPQTIIVTATPYGAAPFFLTATALTPSTAKVNVTVVPGISATPVTTAQYLNVGTPMTNFSPLTNVTGGTTPYTYSITSGTLPAGLSLDTTTGIVSGTPMTATPRTDVTFAVADASVPSITAITTSTVAFTVTPRPRNVQLSFRALPDPPYIGVNSDFEVVLRPATNIVNPPTPGGSVLISDSAGKTICTVALRLDGVTFSYGNCNYLFGGEYEKQPFTLTATYSGDGTYDSVSAIDSGVMGYMYANWVADQSSRSWTILGTNYGSQGQVLSYDNQFIFDATVSGAPGAVFGVATSGCTTVLATEVSCGAWDRPDVASCTRTAGAPPTTTVHVRQVQRYLDGCITLGGDRVHFVSAGFASMGLGSGVGIGFGLGVLFNDLKPAGYIGM